MHYDLYLTKNGDFSFFSIDSSSDISTLEYNFHIAPSDSLLLNFSTINNNIPKSNPGQLDFNFYVYEIQYNKTARTVTDYNFISQAIKLRLNTEIGTISGNEDLGSEFYKVMHASTSDDKLRDDISTMIKKNISDILPNASVDVQLIKTDYLNYHDSIKIVIINNEDTYYFTL